MALQCVDPCGPNAATDLPVSPPASQSGGAGSSAATPLFVRQAPADDTDLVEVDATASATPGVWVELFPADAARNGAAIQNKDAAAIIYFVQANTAPANGTQPGEIGVPVFPGYYNFDWVPKKRYFFRSTVASSKVSVKTW